MDLKELERTITYLQNLHDELQGRTRPPKPDSRVQSVDLAKRVVTMVGLSNGEHEEIRDANYKRQKIQFSKRPDGMWRNENPVYFPVATGTYGADSIILEGEEFNQKVVARMAQPVMCVAGMNGVGFAPNALSVTHEVMECVTAQFHYRGKAEAPKSGSRAALHYEHALRQNDAMQQHVKAHQRLLDDVIESFKKTGDFDALLKRVTLKDFKEVRDRELAKQMLTSDPFVRGKSESSARAERTKDFDDLEELQKHGLLSASGLNPVEPQDGPGYCAQCERISLPRRNQLVSMGHSVSHLVQLPDEQGYALPCKSCRKP